ncbi:hypothetical protein CY34DRAFT_800715 [Suillus luteus UH-Slu-Lm8-n1]|uniref:Uncharacterized protein n=1 Tax=Suillus luteus UH-Slu-Lm8-n1 TaxID=930992 RepID=A0A0D0AWU6_9AGAM|nr:hypothetical protein CY34DRAFT_800715 [Suillus luteus UH-Slu-Lm8-n1]
MSSNTNLTESNQSKADLQRQYRGKEGEGFAELRQAIREVTEGQVDLAKRHETLTIAAQKIREFSRQNEELRRQLNSASDSSWGAQGGQTRGAWQGEAAAVPYAHDYGFNAPGNNFSTAQYSGQYYPGNAAPTDTNYLRGHPGQGRGI